MSGVNQGYYCDVKRGEAPGNMQRHHAKVDPATEDTLVTGKVARLDPDGMAVEGHGTSQLDLLFFAHRGVEKVDVAGISAASSDLGDYSLGPNTLSLIPFAPRKVVRTSAYEDVDWSFKDPVEVSGTSNGTLVQGADAEAGSVIGLVLEEPHIHNDVMVLTVELIRSAPASTAT